MWFAWVSVFELKLLISTFHENCSVVLELFAHKGRHTHIQMDGWHYAGMRMLLTSAICHSYNYSDNAVLFRVCWLQYTWYHCHSLVFQRFWYNSWQWGHYFLKTVLDNDCQLYLHYTKMCFMCTLYNCDSWIPLGNMLSCVHEDSCVGQNI